MKLLNLDEIYSCLDNPPKGADRQGTLVALIKIAFEESEKEMKERRLKMFSEKVVKVISYIVTVGVVVGLIKGIELALLYI